MICVPKIGVVRTFQHILDLCMIDFVETAQFVLLESEGCRSLEMLDAVILKWVLILIGLW
jgi:hypothetical protein